MKRVLSPLLLILFPASVFGNCALPKMEMYNPRLKAFECRDPSIEISDEEQRIQEACVLLRKINYWEADLEESKTFYADYALEEKKEKIQRLKLEYSKYRKECSE